MKGDFSRLTFDPKKPYSGVRMQQGRVQLDADWNEQVDITEHRIEKLFTDLIGDSGAPQGEHFRISADNNGITIGVGRIYVAGLLCENAETCSFPKQPHLPGVALPEEDGLHLCYLDVWQRLITVLEDPSLREPALGGPDTTARVQNVWQVKLEKVKDEDKDEWEKTFARLKEIAISTGNMQATWDGQSTPPTNRLYRVEIHKGGPTDTATFKWSRDNGAIAAKVDPITSESTIVLSQEGPVTQSWFSPNEYIEFSNEALTLNREPGILAKLVRVEGLTLTTDNGSVALPKELGNNPIVRRWDSSGEVKVEAADNDGWIELEHGIKVKFENGNYRTGDYWLIPSRKNLPQRIIFPKEAQSPKGIQHYYAPLALLNRKKGNWEQGKNLLPVFSPLTTGLVSKAGDTMIGPLTIDPNGGAESALNVKGDVHIEGALRGAARICTYKNGEPSLGPCRIVAGKAGPSTGNDWDVQGREATLAMQLPDLLEKANPMYSVALEPGGPTEDFVKYPPVVTLGNAKEVEVRLKWRILDNQLIVNLTIDVDDTPELSRLLNNKDDPLCGWHVSWITFY